MITYEQREVALENLNDVQRILYESYDAGVRLGKIAQAHAITSRPNFAIAIGDVILGLVPQEKLPDLLIERLEITRPEAMKVTADVLDFLAPLSTGQLPPTIDINQTTPTSQPPENQPSHSLPINTTASEISTTLAAEIAETEQSLNQAVQPMRTMAHDMEVARPAAEQTHQATDQHELLQGNKARNPNATWGD